MIARAILSLAAALAVQACAKEGEPHDAGPLPDAATSDATVSDADTATACGPTEFCDPDLEVCVIRGPVGPGYSYTCEPVPAGCELDRSCDCVAATYCVDAFDTCSETPPNTIFCECPACQ
ncbi:MAG TPA: hypothetical protein VL172_13835 [Kofleriaceae bacterium]|jgi:hypothetical protein|nr:hypothetical protein [Kofleriaceae bacterium]